MRVLFRTAALLAVTLVLLPGMEVHRLFASRARQGPVTRLWMRRYGRAVVSLMGARIACSLGRGAFLPGCDERGVGRVFAMNHRSMLDVFVYLSLFEASALSRADLAHWPVIGLAARRVGTLFVDRANRSSGAAAVATMSGALSQGRGILVFPEGTTFTDDEVRPFRGGAFVAAQRAGAEVVPVGIAYESSACCFGDEDFPPHWKRLAGMKRINLAVEIGEPILPAGDPDALREAAQQAVQGLVRRARAKLGGSSG
jgi:1-acyl-sn-glycerol-3-phosphate acyltransferase